MTGIKNEPQRLNWTPDLVSRFWDVFSTTKLTAFSFSKQAGKSLIIAIEHLLPKSGKILDFGAGDGYLVKLMCDRDYRVAAFEPSFGRAEKLRDSLAGNKNFLGVIDSDTKASYDCVIMSEVIEHILDDELDCTLNYLASLVKPNGTLIVTTPNNEDLELSMVYCPMSNLLFHRWQHVRSFEGGTLSQLLSKYGFKEKVIHLVEFRDSLFLSGDSLWGEEGSAIPSHVTRIRENLPTNVAGETNILYVGTRTS